MNDNEVATRLRDRLEGPVVAMTTHFHDDYSLDLDGVRRLTEYYIEEGVPTVIVTGSTGEYGALTDEERKAVQKTVIETARGSAMAVIAGVSDMASLNCIELARYAAGEGADGVMLTPPLAGTNGGGLPVLQNHYDAVSRAVEIGIVIYFSGAVLWQVQDILSDPARMVDLVDACNGNCGAFKDSSGNFAFYRQVSALLGERISVMGSAGMNYYFWGQRFGSRCCLTGLGNIWPRVEIEFCSLMESGQYDAAQKIVTEKDLPYLEACVATGRYWACVKALQEMAGLPGGPMRPPLLDCTAEQRAELRRVCTRIGLLEPA